jgi:hypothetical protein
MALYYVGYLRCSSIVLVCWGARIGFTVYDGWGERGRKGEAGETQKNRWHKSVLYS